MKNAKIFIIIITCLMSFGLSICSYAEEDTDYSRIRRMEKLISDTGKIKEYTAFLKFMDTDKVRAAEHAVLFTDSLQYDKADTLISDIYEYLADYYANDLFRYRTAIQYQDKATEILRQLDIPSKECISEVLSAKYNNFIGRHDIALTQTLSSLNKARECGNNYCLRECYLNLGVTYYYCNEPEKAIESYKRISASSNSIKEDIQRVTALNNLLPFTKTMEQQDSLIQVGLSICNRNDAKSDKFKSLKELIYLNLSLAHMQNGNMDKCKDLLDTSLTFAVNFRDTGFFHTNSGIYWMEKKDTATAIKHFNMAIDYLSRGDFDIEIKYILYFIQNLYARTGDIEKAYSSLLKYNEIDMRLAKNETLQEIFKLQQKIEITELDNKISKDKARFKTISLSMIIILLLIIFILFVIYTKRDAELKKNKAHQEKIQQDLKSKNELINLKRLQQYQENTFIDNIVKQLNDLCNKTSSATMRAEINNLTRQLNESKDKSDWSEAEKSIQEYNTDFYTNLIKEFPNLTPNDRRLCSLIHMNMSTKEIAAITHQSIGSINTARTRLRKKFNITGDDKSLTQFLDRFN